MSLNVQQMMRMRSILGSAQSRSLSASEELELRNLIAQESPSSQSLPTNDLVSAGMTLLGLFTVLGFLKR